METASNIALLVLCTGAVVGSFYALVAGVASRGSQTGGEPRHTTHRRPLAPEPDQWRPVQPRRPVDGRDLDGETRPIHTWTEST